MIMLEKIKMAPKSRWPTLEAWKAHGLEHGYVGRNPKSFETSDVPLERSWYSRGNYKKWSKNFTFDRQEGRWKSLEYTQNQALELMEKRGFECFPPSDVLEQLGCSSLGAAIAKYHGGYHEFREKLNGKQRVRKKGQLKDIDYVIKEIKSIMTENGLEDFPTPREFLRLKQTSLRRAIYQYHGGVRKFKEELDFKKSPVAPNQWKDLEYALSRAEEFLKETGSEVLPSSNIVARKGWSNLVNAIAAYHGGFPHFRRLLADRMDLPIEEDQLEQLLDDYIANGGDNE
jgi:hypothetical protein